MVYCTGIVLISNDLQNTRQNFDFFLLQNCRMSITSFLKKRQLKSMSLSVRYADVNIELKACFKPTYFKTI